MAFRCNTRYILLLSFVLCCGFSNCESPAVDKEVVKIIEEDVFNIGTSTTEEKIESDFLKNSIADAEETYAGAFPESEAPELSFEQVKLSQSDEGKNLLKHHVFLTDKNLSQSQIVELSKKEGVNFIANPRFLSDYQAIKSYEFIFVGPQNVDQAMEQFEVSPSQAKKVLKIYQRLPVNEHIKIAHDAEEFSYNLEQAKKQNKEPIVIFNNSTGRIFTKTPAEWKIRNTITCNSYDLDIYDKSYVCSTTELGLKDVMKSVVQSCEQPDLAQFYTTFFENYNRQIVTHQQMRLVVAAGGVCGIAGGATTILYKCKKT